MAPVVVHTFDRVMMERFQSSSTEFSFKGKLQTYKILQEHSWFVLSNAVITRGTCQKFRKSNEVARCKKLLVRWYNPFAEAAYEPSEVRTNCPYTLEVVEKVKKRKKTAPSTGVGRGRPKKKQAKREGEFDPTMFATVIVNKDKVVKEDVQADWRRPQPYNEKLRRAKTDEERQALAVAQVGVKEALKGRFRKNVVEYPHRCVEAPRPRPIIDLASVKGSTLISEERNYAVVMGSLEQSLAAWASTAGGTLALAPHNIHVVQGGKGEGRDSYTTRRKDNIGHLTINMTKVEAGHGSSSSLDVSLESKEAASPIQDWNRKRSVSLSPRRPSPQALSPSFSPPRPPHVKSHVGLKAQKLDHKPHNSLGAFKIPKKVSNASGIEVASAPLDDEVMKSTHEVMKSMVEVIKLESSSCEEEEECNKTNRTISINEGDDQEPTSDMVECLLDDSKEEEADKVLSTHKEEGLHGVESEAKEEEEKLVDDLLEESIEENAKEEDEFGFLDDLMMDLKENPTEAAQVEDVQQEEELQEDDLLANL